MTMSGELVLSLLHKEGAAALGKLLQEAGVGRLGAEGTPAEELAAGGHTVAAFVCHPQAWYLALWRRGCEGKGALFARLTDESRWARLGRQKTPRAGRRLPHRLEPSNALGHRRMTGHEVAERAPQTLHPLVTWVDDAEVGGRTPDAMRRCARVVELGERGGKGARVPGVLCRRGVGEEFPLARDGHRHQA